MKSLSGSVFLKKIALDLVKKEKSTNNFFLNYFIMCSENSNSMSTNTKKCLLH